MLPELSGAVAQINPQERPQIRHESRDLCSVILFMPTYSRLRVFRWLHVTCSALLGQETCALPWVILQLLPLLLSILADSWQIATISGTLGCAKKKYHGVMGQMHPDWKTHAWYTLTWLT